MFCKKLFVLLRLGLGLSIKDREDLTPFSGMTEEEWRDLMNMAQEQGVLGIAVDGLSQLGTIIGLNTHSPWFFESIGGIVTRENLNKQQIKVIGDLSRLWAENGIKMMILKGQANGLFYPNPLHRDCGDIDCYLLGDYCEGNDVIKRLGIKVNEDCDRHSVFGFHGEMIENHQFFVNSLDEKWKDMMESEMLELLMGNTFKRYPNSDILLPPTQFNALFLTYHAMGHFLAGNMRMKQILDWAMFIQSERKIIDWENLNSLCAQFGMKAFLDSMNSICCIYLGMKDSCCDIKNNQADNIIHSILYDRDYIYGSSKGHTWSNRIHFITYVLRNRWKFKLTGGSASKQLWLYFNNFKKRIEFD